MKASHVIVGAILLVVLKVTVGAWIWNRLPRKGQAATRSLLSYGVLIAFGIVFVAPFLWMLSTSLKTDTQIFQPQVQWLPNVPTVKVAMTDSNGVAREAWVPIKQTAGGEQVAILEELEDGKARIRPLNSVSGEQTVERDSLKDVARVAPQWHNYPDALAQFPFLRYLANTLILCTLTMIGTVLSAIVPAYGFARLKWKGRDQLFFLLLATLMLPPQVTMLPVFLLFRSLGWTGTQLPLVVPTFFGSAFYIFLMRQFFMTIPQELSDAARIDGCSEMGILFRILAPISKPAIATVALLSFTSAWMDFNGPLIYLHDERTYTLAVGLLSFLGRHNGEWGLLMAAATVITLPMLILFFFAQRTYIQGIVATGLKG